MLPRKASIFHLGEEGGEATGTAGVAIGWPQNSSRAPEEGLVGLRILIQHTAQGSNVVIKSTMKSCSRTARQTPHKNHHQELGFLKACFFCKTQLSPLKDVYIYRGDQGFCSEECRCRQMLIDERREFEASTRERLGVSHPRHRAADSKVRESERRRRISATA